MSARGNFKINLFISPYTTLDTTMNTKKVKIDTACFHDDFKIAAADSSKRCTLAFVYERVYSLPIMADSQRFWCVSVTAMMYDCIFFLQLYLISELKTSAIGIFTLLFIIKKSQAIQIQILKH